MNEGLEKMKQEMWTEFKLSFPALHSHFLANYILNGEMVLFLDKWMNKASQASREEADKRYEDVFKWLFGEVGDFPDCDVSKMKYAWRSVLRNKLESLRNPSAK